MTPSRKCTFPADSGEKGFILALALMVLVVTLAITLGAASLALFHLKSGGAFIAVLKGTFLNVDGADGPARKVTILGAPEGWDLIHYSTELTETRTENVCMYSIRAVPRQPCMPLVRMDTAPSSRPGVVVVVDESTFMRESSGLDYEEHALYLKKASGAATRISACSEISGALAAPEGTYFRGDFGNSYERAPSGHSHTGAMSCWTLALSALTRLLDEVDQCRVALTSVSGGCTVPFSAGMGAVLGALDALSPDSASAPLAEALYRASGMFSDGCLSPRHILLVTAGVSASDGNLPSWLRDYDKDGDPRDVPVEGEGSHCLDDVAAYAKDHGISVHVIGPDTPFLREVASRGGGSFMPRAARIAPEGTTATVPPVTYQGQGITLTNTNSRLNPTWLASDTGLHARGSVEDPSGQVTCADITVTGSALSCACAGQNLWCTTSRGRLVLLDLARHELSWLFQGVSGEVHLGGGLVLAGPDADTMVSAVRPGRGAAWRRSASCFDSNESLAFIALGTSITACTIGEGTPVSHTDTGRRVTVIRCETVSGRVMAGTSDGLVLVYDQGLETPTALSTDTGEEILDIRPFTLRRKDCALVVSRDGVHLFSGVERTWSAPHAPGLVLAATVVDSKAYVLTWQPDEPCLGADSGESLLTVMDVRTGGVLERRVLCRGEAFGPCLDPVSGVLRFVSFDALTTEYDISSLPFVRPTIAGRKIITPAG